MSASTIAELLTLLGREVDAGVYDDEIRAVRAARTLDEQRAAFRATLAQVTIDVEAALAEPRKPRRDAARKG